MNDLLTWLGQYSLPVVVLIIAGAALLYFAKMMTEKAIAQQFDRYARVMDLQLQRRSNFEERILIERYTLFREINHKIATIFTNLNRMHGGTKIEGLIRDNDVVPLTEVCDLIASNRYLIPDRFRIVFQKEVELALRFANADQQQQNEIGQTWLALRHEFDGLMVGAFGLDQDCAWTEAVDAQ
ncbi:MAG TPA: hypothetical protein VGW40_01945 [Allosphingosinicella sp.]|nr:hypothetical protein [Allosphingosinicella sp.]